MSAVTDAMVEAARLMVDDYQTSASHHPDHVLVPAIAFEALRSALASLPESGEAEPFGYYCECKFADPAFLRKPAYIPPTDDLHKTTPLYTHPVPGQGEVERLRKALRPFADVADFMDSETDGFDMSDKLALVYKNEDDEEVAHITDFELRTFYEASAALSKEGR